VWWFDFPDIFHEFLCADISRVMPYFYGVKTGINLAVERNIKNRSEDFWPYQIRLQECGKSNLQPTSDTQPARASHCVCVLVVLCKLCRASAIMEGPAFSNKMVRGTLPPRCWGHGR
jgi:hypothetical protein